MNPLTLKDKIAAAKATKLIAQTAASEALVTNDTYIDYVAGVEIEQDLITNLDNIMNTINAIPTITTNDGTKFKVNCFSVGEQHFGPVMSRVLGLVNIAGAMFTDERKQAFTKITGISHLVFANAKETIGSPAYFSKGELIPATPGVGSKSSPFTAILLELGISLSYIDRIDTESMDKYFLREQTKAVMKDSAFNKASELDDTEFTLED